MNGVKIIENFMTNEVIIIVIIIVYSPFSMLAWVGLLPPQQLLVVSCTIRNHF